MAAQIATGQVLLALMVETGLSAQDVASRLGLSREQLGEVIGGTRGLTFLEALSAADLFRVSITAFAAATRIDTKWLEEGAPTLAELDAVGRDRVMRLVRRLDAEGRPEAGEARAYLERHAADRHAENTECGSLNQRTSRSRRRITDDDSRGNI